MTSPPRSRATRQVPLATVLLLLALLGAACSTGDTDDSGGEESSVVSEPAGGVSAADDGSETGASGGSRDSAEPALAPAGDRLAIVRTGTVDYRTPDVRDTRTEVLQALRPRQVQVAEESTDADEDGGAVLTTMTLRVPTEVFTAAMTDLERLGAEGDVTVTDSGSSAVDVADQVVDVDVRAALQRRSIERIGDLLERAGSIRDVVGIERELAQREADLGSLQQRQALLADQTSYSTITVRIERDDPPAPRAEDEQGFLAGLSAGSDAFGATATALLTAAGAVLPFAVVVLLVGLPLRVLLRRRRPAAPVRP
ncbi:DUF4349 domain-containing protein [Nocardioides litoris]|uniref:DUF4349 domain-containing protein n=1 Tax=Nocardioides litoris TaxID=1926648 RepID=UPI00112221AC|nr:DUF4349 domain-containing protein [Nocardioides litoris]